MSETPPNWAISTLGAVCTKGQYGWTTRASDEGSVKFLRTTDITKGPITWDSVPYCLETPPDLRKYLVRPNDIVISRAGSVGFSALIPDTPRPTVFASYLIRFRPLPCAQPRYIAYFLRSDDYWRQIGAASAGIALANVNAAKLADVRLPIAPLAEQCRIADKLDALLARVEACRERLDRVPAILRRFREAVLEAAISGRLTEDWRAQREIGGGLDASAWLSAIAARRRSQRSPRGNKHPVAPDLTYWERTLPERWTVASVSAFAECLDYARVPVKREARKATLKTYPYYGANGLVDMVDDFIFDGELVLVTEDETFYGREKPIAYRVSGKCWVNNHAHVLSLPDPKTADYVCYSLMHYNVLPWLTGTTGRAKLTQGVLNSLPISVPPPDELPEIVRRVREFFTLADGLERKYRAAKKSVERLTPAVLAQAFRGELVPREPSDEPADVLLERIKKEREMDSGSKAPAPAKRKWARRKVAAQNKSL